MMALPMLTAVTFPTSSTVAIDGSELLQVSSTPSIGVPPASRTWMATASEAFRAVISRTGEGVTTFVGTAATEKLAVPSVPRRVAEIRANPSRSAAILPAAETLTASGLEDAHSTPESAMIFPFLSKAVMARSTSSPMKVRLPPSGSISIRSTRWKTVTLAVPSSSGSDTSWADTVADPSSIARTVDSTVIGATAALSEDHSTRAGSTAPMRSPLTSIKKAVKVTSSPSASISAASGSSSIRVGTALTSIEVEADCLPATALTTSVPGAIAKSVSPEMTPTSGVSDAQNTRRSGPPPVSSASRRTNSPSGSESGTVRICTASTSRLSRGPRPTPTLGTSCSSALLPMSIVAVRPAHSTLSSPEGVT